MWDAQIFFVAKSQPNCWLFPAKVRQRVAMAQESGHNAHSLPQPSKLNPHKTFKNFPFLAPIKKVFRKNITSSLWDLVRQLMKDLDWEMDINWPFLALFYFTESLSRWCRSSRFESNFSGCGGISRSKPASNGADIRFLPWKGKELSIKIRPIQFAFFSSSSQFVLSIAEWSFGNVFNGVFGYTQLLTIFDTFSHRMLY